MMEEVGLFCAPLVFKSFLFKQVKCLSFSEMRDYSNRTVLWIVFFFPGIREVNFGMV